MKPIARFQKGDSTRTALHADVMNEIVDRLNMLSNCGVFPPGLADVRHGDAAWGINFTGDAFQEVAENGVISYFFVVKRTGPIE